jgi:predicted 3-demethylubiquinone-9 3-methyltransferase (glyoxalase superfamily)
MGQINRYPSEGFETHQMPAGSVMTVEFVLEGQSFLALNAGPAFKFTEAISFMVNCDSQDEIDYYWQKLNEGGDPKAQQCGWLKDKFGLSWQITPSKMDQFYKDAASKKSGRVMKAMLQMKKLDIKKLQDAYDGK